MISTTTELPNRSHTLPSRSDRALPVPADAAASSASTVPGRKSPILPSSTSPLGGVICSPFSPSGICGRSPFSPSGRSGRSPPSPSGICGRAPSSPSGRSGRSPSSPPGLSGNVPSVSSELFSSESMRFSSCFIPPGCIPPPPAVLPMVVAVDSSVNSSVSSPTQTVYDAPTVNACAENATEEYLHSGLYERISCPSASRIWNCVPASTVDVRV